ncbi:MAG TPA: serine/threonine-protein kinase [Verrucomicrobiae bacterium]|jgi:serine/threonine protein kinase
MDEQTQTNPFPPDKLFVPPPGYNDISGQSLGGYRLVKKIAQGGMGVIYEAIQVKLSRKVALKVLSEQLASRPEFLQRFEREAKAAAALNHPNIVQVHDFGEADGRHYIIMEFIEGDNLSNYVTKHGKIPVENALAIIEQAALALKAASEKSIVHRDIKPSNLMVTRDGRVKVADMGLAKILTEDSELTMSSVSIGSPHFIAPEQASSSKNADHRVDIYSLGVTLLYLVTGKYAYDGDSPISIVLAHATKPLPSGAELGTDLPQEIEALIRRMAAKNPDQRYQNYDELLADLQLVKQGYLPMAAPVYSEATRGRSKSILVAAVAIIAVAILAVAAVVVTKILKQPAQSVATHSPGAASTPSTPPVTASPQNQPPPQQPPDNMGGQPPMAQGQMPDQQGQQGFGGNNNDMPRFPLPMGPPPQMSRANLIPDGSLDTMLATADDYAKQNQTDYLGIIARYQIVLQKANQLIMQRIVDTAQAQVIQTRLQTWQAAQNSAATLAISQFTTKMQQAMANAGPMAGFNAWKTFPSNLRSRETDQQIIKVLKQLLPPGFQPPMNGNGRGPGNGQRPGNGQGPRGQFGPNGNNGGGPQGPPPGMP